MYHKIENDQLAGRTAGIGVTVIPPAPNDVPTVVNLTVDNCRGYGYWPEVMGSVAAQPHRFSDQLSTFIKHDPDETVLHNVAWTEWSVLQALETAQRELVQKAESVLLGGYVMTQGQTQYWVPSTERVTTGRLQYQAYVDQNGWPGDLPVYLMPQPGDVGLYVKIKVNQAQWNEVLDAGALHRHHTMQTADNTDDALVAAYDNGNGTAADIAAVPIEGAPWPANPPSGGP